MSPAFERVIMADWSAASTPGPPRPAPDRCWLAWGDAGSVPRRRPAPIYCRTRAEACARIQSLASACPGRTLVGLDFPFGYPRDAGLPSGRALCELLARLIRDEPDGANNRFEAAARLNAGLAAHRGVQAGPFWGCARGVMLPGLPATRPVPYPVTEYRRVETLLRARGRYPQPVFKLAGVGSVGSQTLLGLAGVHRMLADPALTRRGVLWPFETAAGVAPDAVVFAEIWPSLGGHRSRRHPIKDARQVAAARDEVLDGDADPLHVPPDERDAATAEGWILGVPSDHSAPVGG
jgi:precorrin-8X/cobalt-precorrin-8 methylmutase